MKIYIGICYNYDDNAYSFKAFSTKDRAVTYGLKLLHYTAEVKEYEKQGIDVNELEETLLECGGIDELYDIKELNVDDEFTPSFAIKEMRIE